MGVSFEAGTRVPTSKYSEHRTCLQAKEKKLTLKPTFPAYSTMGTLLFYTTVKALAIFSYGNKYVARSQVFILSADLVFLPYLTRWVSDKRHGQLYRQWLVHVAM